MDIEKITEETLANINKNFYKKINDSISLKENQIEVLEKYKINFNSVSNIRDLLFIIEEVLEECFYPDDLEQVSLELSEYNYYNNTNK